MVTNTATTAQARAAKATRTQYAMFEKRPTSEFENRYQAESSVGREECAKTEKVFGTAKESEPSTQTKTETKE